MRGLSESAGSWKIICALRRMSSSCLRLAPTDLRPLTRMLPRVGADKADNGVGERGFPHPDSPTRPSVSPAWR